MPPSPDQTNRTNEFTDCAFTHFLGLKGKRHSNGASKLEMA